jgi:predicted dinucleotide-binding enzyme
VKIGIIGSGHIGGNAGRLFAKAGHEVLFSFARDPQTLAQLAAAVGPNARAGTPREAAMFGEVVMLSVPWSAIDEALAQAGSLDGAIVIAISAAC